MCSKIVSRFCCLPNCASLHLTSVRKGDLGHFGSEGSRVEINEISVGHYDCNYLGRDFVLFWFVATKVCNAII